MLDANLKSQLQGYLERISQPVEIVASLDDGEKSAEMLELLERHRVGIGPGQVDARRTRRDADEALVRAAPARRRTAGALRGRAAWATNSPRWCWRCCRPAAIRRRSTRPAIEQIKSLEGDFNFETFVSLTCQSCPDVVQALNAHGGAQSAASATP